MRKLLDWLHQEQAILEASKSHHYLQMNLQTLRHFLGKMKSNDARIQGQNFVLDAARSLLNFSHSHYDCHHHPIQLWLIGILC